MTVCHDPLDTNICSDVIRRKPRKVMAHLQAYVQRGDSIGISAVTHLALRHGEIEHKAPSGMTAHSEI